MSKGEIEMFRGASRNTVHIWDEITQTQECYPNNVLPKSFTMRVDDMTLWVHGNATKHMYEGVSSGRGSHASDQKLYIQLVLADFQQAVKVAIVDGFQYGKTVVSEDWELIIAQPRDGGKYPVVKHARYVGKE